MNSQYRSSDSTRSIERERKRAARAYVSPYPLFVQYTNTSTISLTATTTRCDICRRQKERCDGGVPCRRCLRLGRQCEFTSGVSHGDAASSASVVGGRRGPPRRPPSSVPTVHRMSGGSQRGSDHGGSSVQERRLSYLERIVRSHTGPNTPLDLDSLQSMAEQADGSHRSPSVVSSHEDEVDKSITMHPLDGNVTRKCPFTIVLDMSRHLTYTRLFR